MFDKLFDFIYEILSFFKCWEVLDCYEKGVRLRLGKLNAVWDEGGLKGMLPFYIDRTITTNSAPEPLSIEISFRTTDNIEATADIAIAWGVRNVKQFLIETEDAQDMVAILAEAACFKVLHRLTWDEVPEAELRDEVHRAVTHIGVHVKSADISTVTRAIVIRHLGSLPVGD